MTRRLSLVHGEGSPLEQAAAGLLIRVWVDGTDPGAVRARLMTLSADGSPRTWSAAGGRGAVLAAVQQWMGERLDEATGRVGG